MPLQRGRDSTSAADSGTHKSPATITNFKPTPYLGKPEGKSFVLGQVIYHHRTHKGDTGSCLLTNQLGLTTTKICKQDKPNRNPLAL